MLVSWNILLCLLNLTIYSFGFQVAATDQRLKQCYPKFDNHTLCMGLGILNSVNSFAGLLRNSRSGFSIHQSNVWIILLHTKCHSDLEKLLCSIYAPICLKGHHFTRVLPCQELCYSVREKCLPRMKIYGFEWPAIVDCAKFPSDNETNCIQLTDNIANKSSYSKIKRQREDRSLNQTILSDEEERRKKRNCQICNQKVILKVLTKRFCEYSLAIKAKISNIFQKPNGAISVRLQHKSKIIFSSQSIKTSLTNLITEIQCKCPVLQNTESVSRGKWLLIGDIENGQFIVKFLSKWQRKRKKFLYLFRLLQSHPEKHCKNQKNLLKMIKNHVKRAETIDKYIVNKSKRQMNYSIYGDRFYSTGDSS